MNSTVLNLNRWAEPALALAWPMLWQSSLLIAFLFALDFAFRRRVRASVRYALWLVVLLKLVLPPSLALPTGLGWWLRPAAAAAPRPHWASVVVTYAPAQAALPLAPISPARAARPPARLSAGAWALAGSGAVSLILLGWMLVRWRQVAREARGALPAPDRVEELFVGARSLSGLRRPARVRLIARPMSPAVCGLFRPVILLPRVLAEQLPPDQLRAVLLHELVHLRRGDLWLSFAQALLQIVYWWHPLLWAANARIRRAREEAVDDAVMLALEDQAEAYAPTLLQVARLALARPPVSLGLVGILESGSFLRQRIERLLDFHPPRKAGLTLASVFSVAAFAALALPMGQAPAPAPKPEPAAAEPNSAPPATSSAPATVSDNALPVPNPTARTNRIFTGRGRQMIVSKLDKIRIEDFPVNKAPLVNVPLSEVVKMLDDLARRRDPTGQGINFIVAPFAGPATTAAAGPTGTDPATGLPIAAQGAETVDMNTIGVTISLVFHDLRLADLLEIIVRVADKPIKYSIEDNAVVFSLNGRDPSPLYFRTIKVDPNAFIQGLQGVFGLDWGTLLTSPSSSSTGTGGGGVATVPHVNIAPSGGGGLGGSNLLADPSTGRGSGFVSRVNSASGVQTGVRSFFQNLGVDLTPPKTLFFNDREGTLFIYASLADLDIIERAVQVLNAAPAQPPASEKPGPSRSAVLLQDGKLRYEMGKLDEAEAKLKEAGRLDPRNEAVGYYLDLIREAREALKKRDSSGVIRTTNDPPYKVENHAVVSSPKGQEATPLYFRTIELDPATFEKGVRKFLGLAEGGNRAENLATMFHQFFAEIGVDISPPKSMFYHDRGGPMLVYASLADLDIIEKAVAALNSARPQLNIQAVFIELPRTEVEGFWEEFGSANGPVPGGSVRTATLTHSQAAAQLDRWKSMGDTHILGQSQVTTLSGRQAEIMNVDIQTIAVGNSLLNGGIGGSGGIGGGSVGGIGRTAIANSASAVTPTTEPLPLGPTLDVIGYVSADGCSIQMTLIPSLMEFIGYDDPGPFATILEPTSGLGPSTPVTAVLPLPHFRIRQVTTSVNVYDGQTVVLRDFTGEGVNKLTAQVPILDDLPFFGRLFRNELSQTEKKDLLILVTPTIIDPAGNRIHPQNK